MFVSIGWPQIILTPHAVLVTCPSVSYFAHSKVTRLRCNNFCAMDASAVRASCG